MLTDKPLTKSQQLRATLYRVWEESAERVGGMCFEEYYQERMAMLIAEVRKELDPPLPDNP